MSQTPFIDVFNCMRRPDEQSFGGGVFVIVDTQQDDSWEVLREKGFASARMAGAAFYITRHICWVSKPRYL